MSVSSAAASVFVSVRLCDFLGVDVALHLVRDVYRGRRSYAAQRHIDGLYFFLIVWCGARNFPVLRAAK